MSVETGSGPEVSFVIPARNEELLLGITLAAIHSAANACGISYEIIVADDASTDRTAEEARQAGARVVPVALHNIGAVRNAGAAQARGRILFFLDADTILPPETLSAALRAVEDGAVGGGGHVRFDARLGLIQSVLAKAFTFLWMRVCGWAAGCNIFVLRSVFESIGGFDTRYFATEERYVSEAIKSQGKFVILRESVLTSARKLRIYSTRELLRIAGSTLLLRRVDLRSREGLEILYDAPRETGAPEGSIQATASRPG